MTENAIVFLRSLNYWLHYQKFRLYSIDHHVNYLGAAEREYQSKCAEVLDDPSTKVDHEEVISLKEAATNESNVEINDNKDVKQGILIFLVICNCCMFDRKTSLTRST